VAVASLLPRKNKKMSDVKKRGEQKKLLREMEKK
jgi:hypothetical protein